VRTIDNNDIDTMFIDRRNSTQHGNTLVICSEGNAGFYEIGIMITAIEAGYSTLGWNHPGFGGSTVRCSKQMYNLLYYIKYYGRVSHIQHKTRML
jgi:hypothetical protein